MYDYNVEVVPHRKCDICRMEFMEPVRQVDRTLSWSLIRDTFFVCSACAKTNAEARELALKFWTRDEYKFDRVWHRVFSVAIALWFIVMLTVIFTHNSIFLPVAFFGFFSFSAAYFIAETYLDVRGDRRTRSRNV